MKSKVVITPVSLNAKKTPMKIRVKLITKLVHPAICLFIIVASWNSSGSPLGVLCFFTFAAFAGFAGFAACTGFAAFATA